MVVSALFLRVHALNTAKPAGTFAGPSRAKAWLALSCMQAVLLSFLVSACYQRVSACCVVHVVPFIQGMYVLLCCITKHKAGV